jgi:hypothetical protein
MNRISSTNVLVTTSNVSKLYMYKAVKNQRVKVRNWLYDDEIQREQFKKWFVRLCIMRALS